MRDERLDVRSGVDALLEGLGGLQEVPPRRVVVEGDLGQLLQPVDANQRDETVGALALASQDRAMSSALSVRDLPSQLWRCLRAETNWPKTTVTVRWSSFAGVLNAVHDDAEHLLAEGQGCFRQYDTSV